MTTTLLMLIVAVMVFCAAIVLLAPMVFGQSQEAKHILEVVGRTSEQATKVEPRISPSETLQQFGRMVRGRLGFAESTKTKKRLSAAGYRGASAGELFFAMQCLIPLTGVLVGSFISTNTMFWVCSLGAIGYIAPDFWLTTRINKRKRQIRLSLPDAIDLLVICVDAGLGLDQALIRVTDELALSHPQIHQELIQVNLGQRAGLSRLEAWRALAERTDVEEFAAFANMLTQTDRFGTPIAKALARFAEDLRQDRRQRVEEAAVKTKIKIIFPLVFFIFPSIFIAIAVPPFFSIMKTLKGIGQ